jgi:hypothetical protein
MPAILAINPTPKKRRKKKAAPRKAAKKPATKRNPSAQTAKRRRARRAAARARIATMQAKGTLKNPKRRSPMAKRRRRKTTKAAAAPRRRRRHSHRISAPIYHNPSGGLLAGLDLKGAASDLMPMLAGALLAKFAGKKFASTPGAETDNWSWQNYLWGAGGGIGGALLAHSIFGTSSRTAQKALEGAFLFLGMKAFTTELAPKNSTLMSWFGQDETAELSPEYMGAIPAYLGAIPNYLGEVTAIPAGMGQEDTYIDWSGMGAIGAEGDMVQDEEGNIYSMDERGEWNDVSEQDRYLGEDDEEGGTEDMEQEDAEEGWSGENVEYLPKGMGETVENIPRRLGQTDAVTDAARAYGSVF